LDDPFVKTKGESGEEDEEEEEEEREGGDLWII